MSASATPKTGVRLKPDATFSADEVEAGEESGYRTPWLAELPSLE